MRSSSTHAHRGWAWAVLCVVLVGPGLILTRPSRAAAQTSRPGEWVVPERRARRPNPVEPSAQVLTRGRDLYKRECETCHGRAGQGDGPKARELEAKVSDLTEESVQQQSDGALFYKITEGRGDMPNNKTNVSEEERWMIVHYLRTLAAERT